MMLGILIALAAPLLVVLALGGLAVAKLSAPATLPALLTAAPSPTPTAVPQAAALPVISPTATEAATAANAAATQPAPTAAGPASPTPTWTVTTAPGSPTTPTPTITGAAPTPGTSTFTPTPTATSAGAQQTPSATATPTPTASTTPTPSATVSALEFVGLRSYYDQDLEAFRVVGEILNHASQAQQIAAVNGTFFNDQNQIIAANNDVLDFVPQSLIPPGGRVPFDLLVDTIQSAARFDISGDTTDSLIPPRTDLNVSGINQTIDASDRYCLSGTVQNPGDRLTDSLVTVAVLYDAQGLVINFANDTVPQPATIYGSVVRNFNICVPPPNDNVARYEVRAIGY